jgi:hypothetical protein
MCRCEARGLTTCLVCCGLLFAPFGAKNPPSTAVGHVLTAPSSTGSISSVSLMYGIPSTVTGAVRRLPTDLPKAGVVRTG